MGQVPTRSFQMSDNVLLNVGFQDSGATSSDGLIPVRKLNDRFGFVRGLFLLARQKVSWSPDVIAGEFWRLLTNIRTHREILKLLKLRPFDEILQNNPGFAFKYVSPNYLARGFTVAERAACFLHHYKRLHATFPEKVLRQILQRNVTLHEMSNGVSCVAWTMGSPEFIGRFEGELSLDLRLDHKKIFTLSFTIVPGCVLKLEGAEVLLITHLQGTKGCSSEIKFLRKVFNESSSRKLLLAALQGIAGAFGINELAAVCATNQTSYKNEHSALFRNAYDDFFDDLGMVKTTAGFYSISIPIEDRPLTSSNRRNITQAEKRRAMRQNVQSTCAAFLLGAADRAAFSSSVTVNSTQVQGTVEPRRGPTSSLTPDYDLTLYSDLQHPD